MNKFEILRAIYRRLRPIPVIGTLIEAVRYRRLPVLSTAGKRYAAQQALLEAHGHALAGLRQTSAQSLALLDAHGHALTGLRQAVATTENLPTVMHALEAEIYKQAHNLNLRIDAQQSALEQRLEFQRQETMFELRYRSAVPDTQPASVALTAPRLVNPEKLHNQQAQGAIRLNVGCGHKPDPQRINVDMRELPGVDIVATVDQLPFTSAQVQEIYSAHLLEHFPLEQLRRSLLPNWISLLQQGGELRAIVPDASAMLDAYAKGQIDFSTLRLVTFGGQEYEVDFHHTMFTPESLAELFTEQGLENVQIEARSRINGLCFECQVVGVKPCR